MDHSGFAENNHFDKLHGWNNIIIRFNFSHDQFYFGKLHSKCQRLNHKAEIAHSTPRNSQTITPTNNQLCIIQKLLAAMKFLYRPYPQ